MYDAPHTSQLCASPANLFWDLYNFLIGYIISECTCESPIEHVISEPIGLEPTRNAPMSWDLYNFLIGYIISECRCESPIGYVISEPIGLEPTRNAPMRSEPIESDET